MFKVDAIIDINQVTVDSTVFHLWLLWKVRMSSSRFLFSNGILSNTLDTPPVKLFLEAQPGAYTTSRTHNNASCFLFWERHMKRLSESIRILSTLAPHLLFKSNNSAIAPPSWTTLPIWQPTLQMLVDDSMQKVMPIAIKERVDCQELAVTTLVSGNLEELNACETIDEDRVGKILDVHVHIETYVPPAFGILGNGAHLALAGYGRHVAIAKYSDWVRIRKSLEKLRPPSVTELLLSNDGNHILEEYVGVKVSQFEKLLHHGRNMESGRRHSSQVSVSFHLFFLVLLKMEFNYLRLA
ncbi:hypothetical protein Ahy_A02g006636 isoform E [Arachis hypogaea]|uniref:Aminotransferase class IV n=1 Tax=Arachis hypogaea TaxID=3818 RepID=A0A445EAU2_ARAHY|nr:hypothetical protein Ahy_A02g006636 isoform E [Arachis hypogaea]